MSKNMEQITIDKQRIGMLRQWINEDVKSVEHKLVSNGEILYWLTGDECHLDEPESNTLEGLSQEFGLYDIPSLRSTK